MIIVDYKGANSLVSLIKSSRIIFNFDKLEQVLNVAAISVPGL